MCDRLYCMTVIVSSNLLYIICTAGALLFASGWTDDRRELSNSVRQHDGV